MFPRDVGIRTVFALGMAGLAAAAPQQPAATAPPVPPVAAISKYCVTCHNQKLKTGSLALDTVDPVRPAANAEIWEKVVKKLRAGAMPPPGAPQPGQATSDALATTIETALDRAAAARPDPGKLPLLHRLTRTEYQNTIRDLLAIDAIPKEMDYAMLLPPDNASSGFDNIADLLFVSPAAMERYVGAANKISRLAIGDPSIPEMVDIYRFPGDLPQDVQAENLPFGTRSGIAVRTDLALDGEYVIKVELAGASRDVNQLEVSVDGARAKLVDIAAGGGRGAPPPDTALYDTSEDAAASGPGRRGRVVAGPGRAGRRPDPEIRLQLKAGLHKLGVTFIQHNEARDESTVRPRPARQGLAACHREHHNQRSLQRYVPVDTASRKRIFACHPARAEEELPCAKQILLQLERHAYRRPVTDADLDDLLPFYTDGRSDAGFDTGIERALEKYW